MDSAAKIVIQTIITSWTSLWILKKKKGIPRVAKMKYGAGFMHWCKRLHLISRNHKIFLEEKDKELSSARNSLLSAVQPT